MERAIRQPVWAPVRGHHWERTAALWPGSGKSLFFAGEDPGAGTCGRRMAEAAQFELKNLSSN
jgi:hypothetical protein